MFMAKNYVSAAITVAVDRCLVVCTCICFMDFCTARFSWVQFFVFMLLTSEIACEQM